MAEYSVRNARREDCKELIRLIKELSEFERTGGSKIDEKDLEQDFFNLAQQRYFCYVIDDPMNSFKIVGYAIFYYHYGTWTGRKMYLRDIYVSEDHRGKGLGHMLFKRVIQEGVAMQCVDTDFTVVNWNSAAQDFFKARGALDITKSEAWHIFRLGSENMKTVANSSSKCSFTVREARREDSKEVHRLIQELANFEHMPEGPQIDEKDLEHGGFNLNPPLFYCYVVDDPNDSSQLIGYAIYYYGYGTLVGPRMYLEDIYVTEAYRGKGVGNILFKRVVQKGAEMKLADMDFVVLDWNPAQEFYKARGAVDITQKEGWHLFRVLAKDMEKIAEQK